MLEHKINNRKQEVERAVQLELDYQINEIIKILEHYKPDNYQMPIRDFSSKCHKIIEDIAKDSSYFTKTLKKYVKSNNDVTAGLYQSVLWTRNEFSGAFDKPFGGAFIKIGDEYELPSPESMHREVRRSEKLIFSGDYAGFDAEFAGFCAGTYTKFTGKRAGMYAKFTGTSAGGGAKFSGEQAGIYARFSGEHAGSDTIFSGKESELHITFLEKTGCFTRFAGDE